ncbi:hypothetical protein ACFYV7_28030 [Nocardia suismassiliense]|uniref:Uncharacterized protein n=1 Tax=Nocardia suismassiliense TaxID=2077092 RepID=A0ABW6QZT4_9NOCA
MFLLHQGDRRGIIAAGALTDGVIRHHGPDWPSMTCVRFETVLPIEDRLPREDLLNKDPNGPWLRAQTSGVELDHRQLQLIESLWAQHLKTLQRDRTV